MLLVLWIIYMNQEIWFSEVMPYMYLITTKFQIQIDKANVEEANDTIVEMKEIKKGLHESLLDQNSWSSLYTYDDIVLIIQHRYLSDFITQWKQ